MPSSGRGRPRVYCKSSCKQRAYEQRNAVTVTPISDQAVVLSPEKVENLRDLLFQIRCAAEDIATAYREDASQQEIQQLCDELVELSLSAESIR
ncbi:hypothetical protein [Corynebacterium sp. sy039]|uniref:hypothetical protein n=2 Tax=Corynebacterium TaxID=1716 RepID=UPI00352D15A4